MLTHIALFYLKEEQAGQTKAENREQIINNVQSLKKNIPQINNIIIADKFETPKVSFPAADLCVYVTFKTQQDYEEYFHHPIHQKAASFASQVSEKVAGITFRENLLEEGDN